MSAAGSKDALWVAGYFWLAGIQISPNFARWDGPLPREIELATIPRYVPPPPPPENTGPQIDGWHSHGIDARKPPDEFANGDFSRWQEAVPLGWVSEIDVYHDGVRSSHPPERLPGGGIRMRQDDADGRVGLRQRFKAVPGQAYRLRVLGRATAPEGTSAVATVSVGLSDYVRGETGHEYGPLHGGITTDHADTSWTWWESQLIMDAEADVGVASVYCRRGAVILEVRQIELDPVAITAADVINGLLDELEARLVPPCGEEVDWPLLRDRYLDRARTTPTERCDRLVGELLHDLPPANIALGNSQADVTSWGNYGQTGPGCVSAQPDRAGRSVGTRDPRAALETFSPQLKNRSRDGIQLVQSGDLHRAQLTSGTSGVVLDLRGSPWQDSATGRREDVNGLGKQPWGFLGQWTDRRLDFGLRLEQRVGATETDTLSIDPAGLAVTTLPLMVLVDSTTIGVNAVIAAAARALPQATVIGQTAGPPYWIPATISLASGQRVSFPDSRFTWLIDGILPGTTSIDAEVVIEDSTATNDGRDPILETALRMIRAAAVRPIPAGGP